MATMNISLPDQMKEWVEAQVSTGKYGNASDFVRDVLRREQERVDYIAYVQKAVDDGIASGFVKYDRKSIEKRLGLKAKKPNNKSAKNAA